MGEGGNDVLEIVCEPDVKPETAALLLDDVFYGLLHKLVMRKWSLYGRWARCRHAEARATTRRPALRGRLGGRLCVAAPVVASVVSCAAPRKLSTGCHAAITPAHACVQSLSRAPLNSLTSRRAAAGMCIRCCA